MGSGQPLHRSECVYVFLCVCVCWHDSPPSPSPPAPAAHTEGDFNSPTCLGRGSDTTLFPHKALQTEGAGGAFFPRGPGGGDKRRSERWPLVSLLLTPAASRRRCCTPGSPLPPPHLPHNPNSAPLPALPTLQERQGEEKGKGERMAVEEEGERAARGVGGVRGGPSEEGLRPTRKLLLKVTKVPDLLYQ